MAFRVAMEWHDNFGGVIHTFIDQQDNSATIYTDLNNLSFSFINNVTVGQLFVINNPTPLFNAYVDVAFKAIVFYNTPGNLKAQLWIPAPKLTIFTGFTNEVLDSAALAPLTLFCIGNLESDNGGLAQSFAHGDSMWHPVPHSWQENAGGLQQRTYMWWVDYYGKKCITRFTTVGDGTNIRTGVAARSNAAIAEYMAGPMNSNVPYAGPSSAYVKVQDQAWLIFEDALGNPTKVVLPAPADTIFEIDGKTVHPAAIGPLIADMIGNGLSRNGNRLVRFRHGKRHTINRSAVQY